MALNDITVALKTDFSFFQTASGDIGQLNGLQNLKRALMRRLVTIPGTLAYRPTYGVGIGMYQNAPNSFAMQQKLAQSVQEQFVLDPRVQSVSGVSVTSVDGFPSQVVVAVTLTPVGYTEQTMLFTPFNEANT